MLTLRGTELQFLLGQCRELSPLSFLIITLMCQADAPWGLVQPLACSEASSEQTHGLRSGSTKSIMITRNNQNVISHAKSIAYHY